MIQVVFFASVKERLDCAGLEYPWPGSGFDLESLREALCEQHGPDWRKLFSEQNLICAVNQEVVNGNQVLEDGDEVAFFPPVTGG